MKNEETRLGCGWNDEWIALESTGGRLEPDQRRSLLKHLDGCGPCAEDLAGWHAIETGLVSALSSAGPSGDIEAGLEALDRARKQGGRRWSAWRWLIPVTAGVAVAMGVAVMTWVPATSSDAVSDGGEVLAMEPEFEGQEELSSVEQEEVNLALADIGEARGREAGAWESFSDETYWDVADELEVDDLEGFEDSLDALLEG